MDAIVEKQILTSNKINKTIKIDLLTDLHINSIREIKPFFEMVFILYLYF